MNSEYFYELSLRLNVSKKAFIFILHDFLISQSLGRLSMHLGI